jgi:hypothetical protein
MTQQKTAWFVQYKDNREIIVVKRIYFRDYEKSKRSRQFLKEWKQNRPWLVDTETGMVCSYCKEPKKMKIHLRLPPRLRGALRQGVRGPLKAPGSPGINGVESCILAISWQQNWPFRNYNLIQKIKTPM